MKWKTTDWIVRILIALGFLFAALGKLMSHPGVLELFERYHLPSGFHLLIGILELIGAVFILVPKTRYVAVGILGLILAGATVVHLRFDPALELIRPAIFAVLLILAAYIPRWMNRATE